MSMSSGEAGHECSRVRPHVLCLNPQHLAATAPAPSPSLGPTKQIGAHLHLPAPMAILRLQVRVHGKVQEGRVQEQLLKVRIHANRAGSCF
jgi:hypothetical protein